nr:hypothetical protein [Rikenellaceae bacterium]
LESYITDRIVLLANVRERVLWGGSLGKFSTQFGLGIKFIINNKHIAGNNLIY